MQECQWVLIRNVRCSKAILKLVPQMERKTWNLTLIPWSTPAVAVFIENIYLIQDQKLSGNKPSFIIYQYCYEVFKLFDKMDMDQLFIWIIQMIPNCQMATASSYCSRTFKLFKEFITEYLTRTVDYVGHLGKDKYLEVFRDKGCTYSQPISYLLLHNKVLNTTA